MNEPIVDLRQLHLQSLRKGQRVEPYGRGYRPVDADPRAGARVCVVCHGARHVLVDSRPTPCPWCSGSGAEDPRWYTPLDRWPLTAEERYRRDWQRAEAATAGDDDRREARIVWGAVAAMALVLGGLALGVSL